MRALIVCKEGVTAAANELVITFGSMGVEASLFFTEPYEAIVNHPAHQKYNNKKLIDLVSIYGSSGASDIINKYSSSIADDYQSKQFSNEELSKIYTYLNTYPGLITDVNKRSYFKKIQKKHVLAYFDMLAEYYEKVISEYKPNFVFDLYAENLSRVVLDIVLKRHDVLYLTLVHSRYKDYLFISSSIHDPGAEFRKRTEPMIMPEDLDEARREVTNYQSSANLLNADELEYENQINRFSIYKAIKFIAGTMIFTVSSMFRRIDKKWYDSKVNRVFLRVIANTGLSVIFYNSYITIIKYFRLSKQIKAPKFKDFYYYPLSYTAEGDATLTRGPWFSDLDTINIIRHYLPFNTHLVLKEHRSMAGERTTREIKWLNKICSIIYIPVSNKDYSNPINLLKRSEGNIALAGTSGLESLLLEKPTLILGNPVYLQFFDLPSVYKDGLKIVDQFFKCPNRFKLDIDILSMYVASLQIDPLKLSYSNLINYDGVSIDQKTFEKLCNSVVNIYKENKM